MRYDTWYFKLYNNNKLMISFLLYNNKLRVFILNIQSIINGYNFIGRDRQNWHHFAS